jgi:hypothetical protein
MEVVMDRNDPLYSEGLVKLRTLKAVFNNLENAPLAVQEVSPAPKEASRETSLIEKCRDRALAEYQEHQKRAEAFHILSDRYRAIGMNDLADTYKDQARLESATTRGFQSVLKAYEKKLPDTPVQEKSKGDLDRAGQYLESYRHDRSALEEQTLQVLNAEERVQKLRADLTDHLPTHAENEQLKEAIHQRERAIRLAELEASNTALAYRGFQREIQAAELHCDTLSQSNHTELEKTGTEDRHSTPSRLNKLAVGALVYQTMKVLDHEL